MSNDNNNLPNRWRERLQIAAQMAAIGSFLAAATMLSIHLGIIHVPETGPLDILSVGNVLRK
jgi:hypothetical protein